VQSKARRYGFLISQIDAKLIKKFCLQLLKLNFQKAKIDIIVFEPN